MRKEGHLTNIQPLQDLFERTLNEVAWHPSVGKPSIGSTGFATALFVAHLFEAEVTSAERRHSIELLHESRDRSAYDLGSQ